MKYAVEAGSIMEPVSLEDAKLHIRTVCGDTSEDSAIIQPIITAAREYCENVTGRAFARQTINAYPIGWADAMQMPKTPVLSVESVTIREADGREKELPAGNYGLSKADGALHLWFKPDIRLAKVDPITIRYQAGYEVLPMAVRQAMLLLIGHWYENREAVVVGSAASVDVSLTAKTLLNQYKVWWF